MCSLDCKSFEFNIQRLEKQIQILSLQFQVFLDDMHALPAVWSALKQVISKSST